MKEAIFLSLRVANSASAILIGFLATFLLVRRLGVDGYASYVIVGAIGIYLSAADIGISRVVYAKLREAFIRGGVAEERAPVAGALRVYTAITIIAVLVFAVTAFATSRVSDASAQTLFFIYVALNFPWILLRYIAWAVEEHVRFDLIDVARRALQICVFLLALTTTDLRIVFALLDLIWLGALILSGWLISRRLCAVAREGCSDSNDDGKSGWWWSIGAFWRRYASMLQGSAAFSLIEFAIYNFPYLFIPILYGKGAPLVAFDLFYKLFRAGVTGNQIASTALLPSQTRAFHEGDVAGVRRWTLCAIALSLIAVSPLILTLAVIGDTVFEFLLSGASVVGTAGLVAVIVAILANSFQNAAGSLLVHAGMVSQGLHISYITLAIMAALGAVTALAGFGFEHFILAYAIAYSLSAAAWTALASRAMRQHFANIPSATTGELP